MREKYLQTTSQDGLIEYLRITPKLVPQCLEVMRKSFYIHETVCAAFELRNNPECFNEIDTMVKEALKDGISIAAVDRATGLVAGVSINKIYVKGSGPNFIEKLIQNSKHPQSKNVLLWMRDIDHTLDIHEHCKVQIVMELMFVCIDPEFRRRGIAKKLFEVSVNLAKSFKAGADVRLKMDQNERLDILRPPEVVTAICTSLVTQKIAKDMNFQIADHIAFKKFGSYDGVNLGQAVTSPESITYEFLRI